MPASFKDRELHGVIFDIQGTLYGADLDARIFHPKQIELARFLLLSEGDSTLYPQN